jgi:hypothetical protein
MAKRGSLYRCHLFSYGGPQTEGVVSAWTQDLAPIGTEEVLTGELVEMHARVDGKVHKLAPDSRIRFDILEEDYLLSGGADDKVLSLVGAGASQPDSEFQTEPRAVVHRVLAQGEEPVAFLRDYRRNEAAAYPRQILLLEQPGEGGSTFHLVAGWTAARLEDYANSELYFIVNVDEEWDDQSEETMDVSPDLAPYAGQEPPPWYPRATVRRIMSLLSTSITDWAVTKVEVHVALELLRSLEPETQLATLLMMRRNGTLKALVQGLDSGSEADQDAWHRLEFSLDPNMGFIVPGDELRVVVHSGTPGRGDFLSYTEQKFMELRKKVPAAIPALDRIAVRRDGKIWIDVTALTPAVRDELDSIKVGERLDTSALYELFYVYTLVFRVEADGAGVLVADGFDVPHMRRLKLSGLPPVEAANVIARELLVGDLLRRPAVGIAFARRGAAYVGQTAPLALLGAFFHQSTFAPDPNSPVQRRVARLGVFGSYIESATATDDRTVTALLLYHKWIEEHLEKEDFFTTEPVTVWEQSLATAFAPPPPTPLDPYLRLLSSLQSEMKYARVEDRAKWQRAHQLFSTWVAEHAQDEVLLTTTDPVKVYVDIMLQATREDVDRVLAEARRKRQEEALKIDFDLVDAKLKEAIDYTIAKVRRTREPYTVEGMIEEGGIGPFFKERRGVGYLVMPSDTERKVRNLIADEYLSDLLDRLVQPAAVRMLKERSIADDFALWIRDRPEYVQAVEIAYSQPYVEKYEFEVELEDWQTTVEVAVGFIPIVGQVVGAIEVISGQSLFGRTLGPVERGVMGLAIFLPAAGKLAGTGGRLIRASQIVKTYNLTTREANALYRAALPLAPGAAGRTLLQSAVDDVKAGRRITDRRTIGQLEKLIGEMGVNARGTLDDIGAPAARQLEGAALASEDSTVRLLRETLGEQTQAYRQLDQAARDPLRAAIRSAPREVRRILAAETEQGFRAYRDELVKYMEAIGMPRNQSSVLEETLAALNRERRAAFGTQITDIVRTRIVSLGTPETLRKEAEVLTEGLRRRATNARAAASATQDIALREKLTARAGRLDDELRRLDDWLKAGNFRLPEFQKQVSESPYLRSLVEAGGEPMLRRLWVQSLARPSGRPLRVGFEEYARILQRHHVGNFGEFETAFRIGETHIILKCPDELVTIPGIDLIAIPKGGGMIHLIDNKALSQAQVDAVDALTRNLPKNLAADTAELAAFARTPDLPKEFADAAKRLSDANQKIGKLTSGMTKQQIEAPAIQRQIDAILKESNIERVVTNAGGEASFLSSDLRAIGLDMANLN